MTTSVCMGIYNGEKFIEKQLFSIFCQTKRPEEVILVDDGSTDATVHIVQQFINKYELKDTWKLIVNAENKGYPQNFYYAMSLCTQEVVFLADQDDIWDAKKLENMCAVLETADTAKAVCCKFGLIDENENRIRTVMRPTFSRGTDTVRIISVKDVFYKCEWPGMVLAYRREWYSQCMAEWQSRQHMPKKITIPHDLLICVWAAEADGFVQMDEELAWHRRHANNAGGEEHRVKKLLNKDRKLREIENYCHILDFLWENEVLSTENGRAALRTKQDSMKGRYEALVSGKIGKVLENARIRRKEIRLATLLCDVMIVKR